MERIPLHAVVTPRLLFCMTVFSLCAAASARAQGITDAFARPVAWQAALERAGFSPGLVDGKPGGKTDLATREYQRSAGLPVTGKLDDATASSLGLASITPFENYTVQASDLQDIAPELHDWNEKAACSVLGYYDALDALAEHFHTSKRFLQALNPGVNFGSLQAGAVVTGPAVLDPVKLTPASLRVDLGRKVIFMLDAQGKTVGLVHCSIAAHVEKRPSGEAQVSVVAPNPDYWFDPAYWPEVTNVTHKLRIPPGPRNPVGVFWVGLNLPGYGMHGTPIPENIGKTGSHGCFRLANWDAVRLGKSVRVGMKVQFISAAGDTAASRP